MKWSSDQHAVKKDPVHRGGVFDDWPWWQKLGLAGLCAAFVAGNVFTAKRVMAASQRAAKRKPKNYRGYVGSEEYEESMDDLYGHVRRHSNLRETLKSKEQLLHALNARRRELENEGRRARQDAEEEHKAKFGQWRQQYSGQRGGTGGTGVTANTPGQLHVHAKIALGLDPNADNYSNTQVMSAFRTKAKRFHPDVNDSKDASEMFQNLSNSRDLLMNRN
jgi:hypothetical protein